MQVGLAKKEIWIISPATFAPCCRTKWTDITTKVNVAWSWPAGMTRLTGPPSDNRFEQHHHHKQRGMVCHQRHRHQRTYNSSNVAFHHRFLIRKYLSNWLRSSRNVCQIIRHTSARFSRPAKTISVAIRTTTIPPATKATTSNA